ncbi:MAG: hypothetical protein CML69_15465 [Rhodobacteraceae bacterium]|nr:hypothetical protein [Paracoccaceae bacterium]
MSQSPSIFDLINATLAGGAFWLSYQRLKDGRRRIRPKIAMKMTPVEGHDLWYTLTIDIKNRESRPITLEYIKAPFWSCARFVQPNVIRTQTAPWEDPTELDFSVNLTMCAFMTAHRVPIEMDVAANGHASKSLFVRRSSRIIFPILRWADSKSHFRLKIHTT